MIAGVGVDVVDIPGFREQLADKASSFVSGTFTGRERQDAEARASNDPARHLAARFAAKEAFVKAWSASRWGQSPKLASVDMREIEVVCDAHGRPRLQLHGAVANALGESESINFHVSLTHDGPTATAFVVFDGAM